MVQKHAELIAAAAKMEGASRCFSSAFSNPYREHAREAAALVPKRVSVRACLLAAQILKDASASHYATIAEEWPGSVFPRPGWDADADDDM